jgi:hypothetical protein
MVYDGDGAHMRANQTGMQRSHLRFSMALGNHGARDRNRMPLYFPAAVLDEHTHDLATVFVPIIGAPPPAARACRAASAHAAPVRAKRSVALPARRVLRQHARDTQAHGTVAAEHL